jgi:transposase-like protein
MLDEGIKVDHATINLWVRKHTPKILKIFQKTKKKVGGSWRLDETYVKVAGQWYYLYRAVDKEGLTIDFYFSRRRNKTAAYKFLKIAIKNNGIPEKINIDKSGANTAGIKLYNKRHGTNIEIGQCKFLNNIIEQDHRKVKRHTKSLESFKNFISAKITLAGIEMMNMLKKRQSFTGSLFSINYSDDFYELTRQ